jgi:hypothetical protein
VSELERISSLGRQKQKSLKFAYLDMKIERNRLFENTAMKAALLSCAGNGSDAI